MHGTLSFQVCHRRLSGLRRVNETLQPSARQNLSSSAGEILWIPTDST
jgi:hypothetical protein